MNSRESIDLGVTSLQIANEKLVVPIKDIRRCRSYDCLYAPKKVIKEKTEQNSIKKQNNVRKGSEHPLIEHQSSSESSVLDESSICMIKTLILSILICLPGNIFAVSIFYKHVQKHHNTLERPNENLTYASNGKSATTHDDFADIGFEITTETVSQNWDIYFFI